MQTIGRDIVIIESGIIWPGAIGEYVYGFKIRGVPFVVLGIVMEGGIEQRIDGYLAFSRPVFGFLFYPVQHGQVVDIEPPYTGGGQGDVLQKIDRDSKGEQVEQ